MVSNGRFEKYIRNCRQSDNSRNTDWVFDDAVKAKFLPNEISPDAESDLRDESWWGIKKQGRTGSCVGFAVADSILRWVFVNKQWIQKEDELSVRYLWMASKEIDEFIDRPTTFIESYGTSIKAALSIVQHYGIVLEKDLPFVTQFELMDNLPEEDLPLYYKSEKAFYAVAAQYRISGYFNLGQDPVKSTDCQNWRRWLASGGGPIAIRIAPDEMFLSAEDVDGQLDNYGGVFKEGNDHACALVGFKEDRFIIRNSWGKDWGKGGYAFATEQYVMKAVKEAYGVIFY